MKYSGIFENHISTREPSSCCNFIMETTIVECIALYYLEGKTGNDTRATDKFRIKINPKEKLASLKKTIK